MISSNNAIILILIIIIIIIIIAIIVIVFQGDGGNNSGVDREPPLVKSVCQAPGSHWLPAGNDVTESSRHWPVAPA